MNVLIADDHELIASGVAAYFEGKEHGHHFFKSKSRAEVLQLLTECTIDVVLQDIQFGDVDGRQLMKEVATSHPKIKFVALSSHIDEFTIKSTMATGFVGYISKSAPLSEIAVALDEISKGNQYISKDIKDNMFNSLLAGKNESITLTKRELEVLLAIQDELSTKEIASKLFVSDKTVEGYRANLFIKFDVKNVAGLVKKAILKGFISS